MSPVVRIVLWCNGSTAVFGSACLGSNPGKTTTCESLLIKMADSLFFIVKMSEKFEKTADNGQKMWIKVCKLD